MQESVFVYYQDDYYENNGVGIDEFESDASAVAFIEGRMKAAAAHGKVPDLKLYTVIRGCKAEIVQIERITSVQLR